MELLAAHRAIEAAGLEFVAPFHSHRRQPANFSTIDLRLHNPAFSWHLIVSYRNERSPIVRAFRVEKNASDFGISPSDVNEDSQLSYRGPEVGHLPIVCDTMSQQGSHAA